MQNLFLSREMRLDFRLCVVKRYIWPLLLYTEWKPGRWKSGLLIDWRQRTPGYFDGYSIFHGPIKDTYLEVFERAEVKNWKISYLVHLLGGPKYKCSSSLWAAGLKKMWLGNIGKFSCSLNCRRKSRNMLNRQRAWVQTK